MLRKPNFLQGKTMILYMPKKSVVTGQEAHPGTPREDKIDISRTWPRKNLEIMLRKPYFLQGKSKI
jgi:hypothetical protein